MTKKRRKLIVLSLSGLLTALVVWLVYVFFFSGVPMFTTYYECAHYDDFDSVKADFERIAEIAQENGEGSYSIIAEMNKYGDHHTVKEIELNSEDKIRIKRIRDYCAENTDYKRDMSNLTVGEYYTWFSYEAIGCGIVKTSDIKRYISTFSQSDEKYGYTKLANDWYAIYV